MPPDSLTQGKSHYCLEAACFLSRMSMHAYCDADLAAKFFINMGAAEVVPVFEKNIQAYVVFFEDFAVISVRGTDNDFEDILTDIDFVKIPYHELDQSEIHRGFKNAADLLRAVIRNTIRLKNWEEKPIYFCGHSLGGAIAQICARDIMGPWYLYPVVYSFGSPRVYTGSKYPSLVPSPPHHRIVNGCDIVPNLPSRSIGFEHTEYNLLYLTSSGALLQDPPYWQQVLDHWLDVSAGLLDGFRAEIPVRRFTRHRIAEYVERLHVQLKLRGGSANG